MLNRDVKQYYFSQLDIGTDAWRVDWFGLLDYPDRTRRSTQPSIYVSLSRVVGNLDDPAALDNVPPMDAFRQQQRWISVGWLPTLRIGDVWQGGKHVLSPEYPVETFADLDVGPDSVTQIKAGASPVLGHFLLCH